MINGHGDDAYRYGLQIRYNFSSNVFGRANIDGLKAHLCRCMDKIGSYPEPEPYTLEAAIAAVKSLKPEEVSVTNGATEAIYLMAQTFSGANVAILQPTFSEYADACTMHNCKIKAIYTLPDKDSCFLLPDGIEMLWLCNPNNPTGKVYELEQLRKLVENNPNVIFVIDQSYEAFTLEETFTAKEAASYGNLLLLHSMTKRYAVPGIRLGYITGDSALLTRLRKNRMPWSVNRLAIEAGIYLVQHPGEAAIDMPAYLSEAERLRSMLNGLRGVDVAPTQTHFMLARLNGGKASDMKDYLASQHGILVRDASNFDGLDERHFRIAAQTPQENDKLVEAIARWLDDSTAVE